MKKKTAITLASVAGICILALLLSIFIDWPVDTSKASGNIAKSSRFSRKTAIEGLSNMQELLENDESFKNGMVGTYLVMNTRANDFCALVELSEQATAGIKEFEPVVKDMKAALPMIKNVCSSMEAAGKDLNTALGGEKADELPQNTNNAALAYNTLQKQNSLADRFIATADEYFSANGGTPDSKIAFVRDQWMEYQLMTAALNQDSAAAAELEKKGYVQTPGESIAAMADLSSMHQSALLAQAALTTALGYSGQSNPLAQTLVLAFQDKSMAQSAALRQTATLEQNANALAQSSALKQTAAALAETAALEQTTNALEQTAALKQNTAALEQNIAALKQTAALEQNVAAVAQNLVVVSYAFLRSSVVDMPNMQSFLNPLANTEAVKQSAALEQNNAALEQTAALKQNNAALEQNSALKQSSAALEQNTAALSQNTALKQSVDWQSIWQNASAAINAMAQGEKVEFRRH